MYLAGYKYVILYIVPAVDLWLTAGTHVQLHRICGGKQYLSQTFHWSHTTGITGIAFPVCTPIVACWGGRTALPNIPPLCWAIFYKSLTISEDVVYTLQSDRR